MGGVKMQTDIDDKLYRMGFGGLGVVLCPNQYLNNDGE
jgi:hypothetical protein